MQAQLVNLAKNARLAELPPSRKRDSGLPRHSARLSWQQACDLGFRGDLGEWERLMGATPER